MGIMVLGSKRSEGALFGFRPPSLAIGRQTKPDLALEVSELAHSLVQEASESARMNREVEIAREVQQRFFPQWTPDIQGLGLSWRLSSRAGCWR